jgi:hypothetical protein
MEVNEKPSEKAIACADMGLMSDTSPCYALFEFLLDEVMGAGPFVKIHRGRCGEEEGVERDASGRLRRGR